jgi:hypothetical protein
MGGPARVRRDSGERKTAPSNWQCRQSGGKSGSYQDWTVTELKKRAKELGRSGYSSLTKDELINKIRNH